MTSYYSQHNKAFVAVDCIIFGFEDNKLKLLLGKRKMDPGRDEWALYGGFVGTHESVDEAAHRVLFELTGLKNLYMKQVHTFGAIDRDPGERVISVAYCALINVKDYDEAQLNEHGVQWVELNKIPPLYSDHKEMVNRAISMLRRRISTEPLSFNLLPDLFTLTQLQHVYEAVLGEEICIGTTSGSIKVKIPANTQNGQKIRLAGCGLVQNDKIGDMIITLEIKIPMNLSDEEINLYKKLKEISSVNIRDSIYDR